MNNHLTNIKLIPDLYTARLTVSTPSFKVFDRANNVIMDIQNESINIKGDLTVEGSTALQELTLSSIDTGLFRVGDSNTADSWDIGFYGVYNDGTEKYAGLLRDASDPKKYFKVFEETTDEPGTTVNIISLAPLQSSELKVNNGTLGDLSIKVGEVDTGLFYSGSSGETLSLVSSGNKRLWLEDNTTVINGLRITGAGEGQDKVLQSDSQGNVSWATITTSSGSINERTGDYTIQSDDYLIELVSGATQDSSFFLPASSSFSETKEYIIVNSSDYLLFIYPDNELIDFSEDYVILEKTQKVRFVNSSTTWIVV